MNAFFIYYKIKFIHTFYKRSEIMTERIAELKDRQVVSVSDGTVLGMVGDIELDTESGRLTAIVIYGKQKAFGILGREDDLVIPWSEIEVIGSETILVRLANFKTKI